MFRLPLVATCECTPRGFENENKNTAQHSSVLLGILTLSQETNPTRAFQIHGADSLLICFFSLLAPSLSCGLFGSSHCRLGESPSLEIVRRLYVLQRSPTEQILVVIIMQIQGWNCISLSGSVQICMNKKRAFAVYSHALCMPSFHPLLCMQNFPKSVRQDTSALSDITVGTEASPHISGVL